MNRPNLRVLLLPNDPYPLKRVHLSELYEKEFTKFGNEIIWILQTDRLTTGTKVLKKKNNRYILIQSKKSNNIISYYLNRIASFKKYKLAKKAMKNHAVDIIISSDGIIEGLIGYRLSKKYNVPFVYYLTSLFFEIDRSLYRKEKNLINLFRYVSSFTQEFLYKYLISKSVLFHPISKAMGDYYLDIFPQKLMFPLPLCPSNYFYNFKKPNRKRMSYKMVYVGQIYPVRNLEFLLKVVSHIKRKYEINNVELYLIGPSKKRYVESLKRIAITYNVERNIKFINEVPLRRIPRLLISFDIGLSLLPPILAYKVSSPTKVVEYLSVGLPVIANKEIDDQKEIIEKSKGGFAVKYDLDEVSKKIVFLLKNKETALEMGMKGRFWIQKNRNYELLARTLSRVYATLKSNE